MYTTIYKISKVPFKKIVGKSAFEISIHYEYTNTYMCHVYILHVYKVVICLSTFDKMQKSKFSKN